MTQKPESPKRDPFEVTAQWLTTCVVMFALSVLFIRKPWVEAPSFAVYFSTAMLLFIWQSVAFQGWRASRRVRKTNS